MADLDHSLAAVRQTVLDLRVATAWLESRAEVDGKRLGILGTSLGSFMGTLTAEMDEGRQRRLVRLGFRADEAQALSALHTRNFM